MTALFRLLGTLNAGAFVVLALIFTALLTGGANSASGAALLALALLACLIGVAALAPSRIDRVIGAYWLSCIAALGFIAWALATSVSGAWGVLPAHPFWSAMGLDAGQLSLSPYRSLEGLAAFIAPCVAFLLGALAAPDSKSRDQLGRWAVALALLYCVIALAFFFSAQARPGGRLDPSASSANAAATTFGLLLVLTMIMLVRAGRGRLAAPIKAPPKLHWARFAYAAPLSLATAILLFAGLLLTASRGGLVATLVALLVFSALMAFAALKDTKASRGIAAAPLLALAVAFVLIFARGGEEVLRRFALSGADAEVRAQLGDAHFAAFAERPLLGHGLNTYHELNILAQTPENWRALHGTGSAHNIFIQALEETGLIGLALFALMLATPLIRAGLRVIGRRSGAEWAAGVLAMTTLVFVHGSVDFGLQVPALTALFAFLLGAGAAPTRA